MDLKITHDSVPDREGVAIQSTARIFVVNRIDGFALKRKPQYIDHVKATAEAGIKQVIESFGVISLGEEILGKIDRGATATELKGFIESAVKWRKEIQGNFVDGRAV